ncbi:DUF167 domain-containing protein [Pseudooceanicola onchidii]|uniref:DUF167 domain-containing protein n=1 Tax=Pseudooceanicola onchidii TaxID=2562279 RepID=UPI0010AA1F1A|nr:DUF167 domain-containing protein [Pseudooceanicola onchidii]
MPRDPSRDLPDLGDLARPGAEITLRVTPRAARNRITREGDEIRVYTTTPPEDGRANAAVARMLAKALGVPKTSLTLIRGQTSRDKTFRIAD